jgi:hypothetical protein
MPLFGREKTPRGGGNEAFWAWWASAKDRVASGIEDGSVQDLVTEISAHVDALHPQLAWELSKGSSSRHAFCLSPEGNAEVRPSALEWLAAAPAPDPVWEYHASRQAGNPGLLDIGNGPVDLTEMRAIASWDEGRELASLRLWNPAFATLSTSAAMQIAFLFLDNLLGEDDVERWIGPIETSQAAFAGRTPGELKDEIGRRAAAATRDHWILAQRTDRQGNRAVVSANAALKRIDLPFASSHLEVSLGFGTLQLAGRGDDRSLDDAEDELIAELEKCGTTFAGRVTEAKKRTLHFVAADPQRSAAIARTWSKEHPAYSARVEHRPDPKWEFRAQLLG